MAAGLSEADCLGRDFDRDIGLLGRFGEVDEGLT